MEHRRMNPEQWAEVLGKLDETELPAAILMMADEDWIRDKDARWLRKHSGRLSPKGKKPDRGDYTVNRGFYWCVRAAENEKPGKIPRAFLDVIGAVNCDDDPDPRGHYTAYCTTKREAWAQLLWALHRRGERRGA